MKSSYAQNSTGTVGIVSGIILQSTKSRQSATFTNCSSGTVFLSLSGTSKLNEGVFLAEGDSFTLRENNLYNGDVSARTKSGTAEVSISEVRWDTPS